MKIIIRKGTKQDIPRTLELVKELALFEKEPEQVITNVEQMLKDGFGEKPVYRLLVADVDEMVQGIAIYFIKYSTWKGKGIYLDDIIVQEKFRGMGIGKKLFNEVMEECKRENCRQLHWQVLDWNEPAINFYKKYNATFDKGWINCKINF